MERVPGGAFRGAVCVPAAVLASMVVAMSASGQERRLNFVSCPIVRDTPSVPCWLSEYEGELYYLGIQTDVSAEFHPPYLGHRVLVEGVVDDARRICGGIVLEPVRISVMPELDAGCNTMLPAEERYTIDFNPRPPGPSGGRLAFDGPPVQAEEALQPPFEARIFELTFDFERGVSFGHPAILMQILNYAKAIGSARITVHGSRGATLLSDGSLLTEQADIAQRRAEEVAALLAGAGAEAPLTTTWSREAIGADGVEDWRSRGVKVVVEP